MDATALLVILSRWVHVISACLLVGSAFFFWIVLPLGLRELDAEQREGVLLRCRRGFKMIVHPTILLFLISGIYNAMVNWNAYRLNMPWTHAFFGLHLLMALGAWTILLILLAGREPKRTNGGWLRVSVLLMFLGVAAASCLKWAREHPKHMATTQPTLVQNP